MDPLLPLRGSCRIAPSHDATTPNISPESRTLALKASLFDVPDVISIVSWMAVSEAGPWPMASATGTMSASLSMAAVGPMQLLEEQLQRLHDGVLDSLLAPCALSPRKALHDPLALRSASSSPGYASFTCSTQSAM